MKQEELFRIENEKLKKVIELINEKIDIAQRNFDSQQHFIIGFKEGQRGTQFTRQSLMSLYATEVNNLKSILSNPYFGMFEFQKDGENESSKIYIGKKAVKDKNENIIAFDWRSPMCSMYYDYNIGDAEYILNGEIEKGKILNKRQISIKDGNLVSVDEQDTLSNDKVLLKYLSENADSRLKSIIATIQREQNTIIRSPLKKNYIVQGVAGSGKTTVALHRVAYLLYNEAKNINESEFMILGPNKYFLNYISELLPDLDIENVSQNTFDEIALENIGCKVKLESKNKTLQNVLAGNAQEEVINFKSSIEFLKILENFVNMYVDNHLQDDLVYGGIKLFDSVNIKSLFSASTTYKNKNFSEIANNLQKLLTKKIKEDADDLCHDVWLKYRDEFLSLPADSPRRREIIEETDKIKAEIKKGCPTQIKEYFKFLKVNPLILYSTFIDNLDKLDVNIPINVSDIQSYSLSKLSKKQVGFEDLTPLLLINYLMNGSKNFDRYSHLVIDEAQDLSLAQYYMLQKLFPNANMDIFGDVNQSIYDYQSIHDWNELNDVIFDSKANLLDLNKSYRTTMQISDAANLVLDNLNYGSAECIARTGKELEVNQVEGNSFLTIANQIKNLLDKKYQTIAIICKDDEETKKVYNEFKKHKLDITMVSETNEQYNGGLCIMPSYLSKGLEFDAVILYNANDVNYSNSDIDMKLLYVSMTRAMHELCINYQGDISPALRPLIKDNLDNPKLVKTKKM